MRISRIRLIPALVVLGTGAFAVPAAMAQTQTVQDNRAMEEVVTIGSRGSMERTSL